MIIMVTAFKPVQDVTDVQIIAAHTAVINFLKQQEGVERADLAKGHDNNWLTITYWSNPEHARSALTLVRGHMAEVFELINGASLQMNEYDIVSSISQ